MADAITAFIESQRRSLNQEKEEFKKEDGLFGKENLFSARNRENEVKMLQKNEGLSLNLGSYESKREKLQRERHEEYKSFLREKNLRTYGESSPGAYTISKSPRNQREAERESYKDELEKEYSTMLENKKSEEKLFRVQFDDQPVNQPQEGKKTIVFDSDEEELFEFVKREKKKTRRRSAGPPRKSNLDEFKKAVVFEGRAKSVPTIFGGDSNSDMKKERQLSYRKELEEQIKEKERMKDREKQKKMGRITSAEFAKYEGKKDSSNEEPWVKPYTNRTTSPSPRYTDDAITRSPKIANDMIALQKPMDPYQMYLNQTAAAYGMPNAAMMAAPMGMYNWPQATFPMMQPAMPQAQPIIQQQHFQHPNEFERAEPSYRKQWTKPNTYNTEVVPPLNLDSSPRSDYVEPFHSRTSQQPPGGKSHSLFQTSPRDDGVSKVQKQKSYKDELLQQIELKKQKEAKEKAALNKYEEKLEKEIASYDPWGKEGGGAPVKNQQGKIVANLRLLRASSNETGEPTERFNNQIEEDLSPLLKALQSQNDTPPQDDAPLSSSRKDHTYARGAALRELKGTDQSPRDKNEQEEYKRYLQAQVEEKKKKEEEVKEKARLEEQRENQRLLEQQKRLQEEYEKEQLKQKQKEEELRKQNEQLRLEAERKRMEAEQRKKEIQAEQDEILRKQAEMKFAGRVEETPRQETYRSSSPPVPAVIKERKKSRDSENVVADVTNDVVVEPKRTKSRRSSKYQRQKIENDNEYVKKLSDNLEAHQKATSTNMHQQDYIIEQLSALRKQLQKQEVMIQQELDQNKIKYKDMVSKPKTNRPRSRGDEIFERATRKASAKKINVDEDRLNARGSATMNGIERDLDQQQQEYMRQQEERLKLLRENIEKQSQAVEDNYTNNALSKDDGISGKTSNSRIPSARARRREKQATIANVFDDFMNNNGDNASITTLQIEEIDRKNDARLRKFRDRAVTPQNDADDLLNDFMKKK